VTERIEEATLPVRTPRCLVIAHGVATSIRAGGHGASNEVVWVVHKNLNANGRGADI